jgi:hypothetical protein
MSLLLAIVGYSLLGLLGLLALLVAVPFELRGRGRLSDEAVAGDAVVSWGFGLLGVRLSSESGVEIRLFGRRVKRVRLAARSVKEKKPKKGAPRRRQKRSQSLSSILEHLGAYWHMAGRLVGALRLRLYLSGVVGLDDPSTTWMAMEAARRLDGLSDNVIVDIEFNFLDEDWDVEAEMSARLWLLHLLVLMVAMLIKRETRQALLAARA